MPRTTQQLELLRLSTIEGDTVTVDGSNDLVFVADVSATLPNDVGTAAADQVGGGGLPNPGTNNEPLLSDGAGKQRRNNMAMS